MFGSAEFRITRTFFNFSVVLRMWAKLDKGKCYPLPEVAGTQPQLHMNSVCYAN